MSISIRNLKRTILARLGTPAGADVSTDIATIDALHDVPTADVSTNSQMRDVTGNKTDAAAVTVTTTKTLMAYIKGVLNELAKVPKSDAAVTFNATALASVNAEVDTALNTIVPASPTAGSLNDFLSKAAGGNTFNKATDSAEMLSDKIGAFTGDGGAAADDSVKAALDLLATAVAAIKRGALTRVTATTASATFVTIAEVTGTGILYQIFAVYSGTDGDIKITVDSATAVTLALNSATRTIARDKQNYSAANSFILGASNTDDLNIEFQTHLLIEGRSASGTNASICAMYGED